MTGLYSLTLLLSAALLFAIQPMAAKAALPELGGSPAVWTTCLAFFQATLLAGYGYAYLLTRRLGPRGQAIVHLAAFLGAIAVAASGVLPRGGAGPSSAPAFGLLGELVSRLGPPLLVVSANAPLLQGWFARGTRRDPYFLYAASNAGSLLALLAYPALVEPRWELGRQAEGWVGGLIGLAALVATCAVSSERWRGRRAAGPGEPPPAGGPSEVQTVPARFGRWAVLAFVPSSLLAGVTQYATTDLAAVPLLWVVPLALYLATFVAAFARRPRLDARRAGRLYPLGLMALGPALAVGLVQPFWVWLPLHLLAFTLAALALHGELAASRPEPEGLPGFYLAIAVGGAAGGAFNAWLAPALFDRGVEYPLMLVGAAVLLAAVPRAAERARIDRSDLLFAAVVLGLVASLARDLGGWSDTPGGALAGALATGMVVLSCVNHRTRPVRFALTFGAAVAAGGLWDGRDGRTLLRHRDFFGILRVTRDDSARCVRLFHGSTLHGEQSTEPGLRREPRAYFDRSGPVGDLLGPGAPEVRRVAVVGLGCGTLAAYAKRGQSWTFFELDPAVVRIARDPRHFTYLADAPADEIAFVVGDARHSLRTADGPRFDLIIMDAFGSDSVPVHLLTVEALEVYRRRLEPGGRLAFNVSNNYLDLEPVVGALAASAGWACRGREDREVPIAERRRTGKQPTIWAVMAADGGDLGPLAADPRWVPARMDPAIPAWTDEASNVFRSLRLSPGRRRGAEGR